MNLRGLEEVVVEKYEVMKAARRMPPSLYPCCIVGRPVQFQTPLGLLVLTARDRSAGSLSRALLCTIVPHPPPKH